MKRKRGGKHAHRAARRRPHSHTPKRAGPTNRAIGTERVKVCPCLVGAFGGKKGWNIPAAGRPVSPRGERPAAGILPVNQRLRSSLGTPDSRPVRVRLNAGVPPPAHRRPRSGRRRRRRRRPAHRRPGPQRPLHEAGGAGTAPPAGSPRRRARGDPTSPAVPGPPPDEPSSGSRSAPGACRRTAPTAATRGSAHPAVSARRDDCHSPSTLRPVRTAPKGQGADKPRCSPRASSPA